MTTTSIVTDLDRYAQMYPVLTPDQIERITYLGHVRKVAKGDILYRPDDVGVPFYILLSGSMEIIHSGVDGEHLITTYTRPGQFSGEITMITGQRCLVLARVTESGEFIEIKREALLSVLATDMELSEILLRAFILRRHIELIQRGYGNVLIMGSRYSAQTLALREFLTRNGHPYTYVDLDTDNACQELLDRFGVSAAEVPIVICNGNTVLKHPSIQRLAACLGFNASIDSSGVRDLVIVGAGPAGLAGAVYAASEGLNALLVETHAPGGQAASSSKIENYLGFPTGISGQELASRATAQAMKFGANMMIARTVLSLNCDGHSYQLTLDCGEVLLARSILIATGAQYNKIQLEGLERFEGNGVYCGATHIESQLSGHEEVAVVGGGNSAGQAAVFLSQTSPTVHMLVRGAELPSTMSRYLTQRLNQNSQIRLHFNTEIIALEGNGHLERITWCDKVTGKVFTSKVPHLFIMTGASPRTDWLRGVVALDENGFIKTGRDIQAVCDGQLRWRSERMPETLETTLPGVFAVGDVRSGNVKRVASAVGEGAIAVHMVHRVLAGL